MKAFYVFSKGFAKKVGTNLTPPKARIMGVVERIFQHFLYTIGGKGV